MSPNITLKKCFPSEVYCPLRVTTMQPIATHTTLNICNKLNFFFSTTELTKTPATTCILLPMMKRGIGILSRALDLNQINKYDKATSVKCQTKGILDVIKYFFEYALGKPTTTVYICRKNAENKLP